jgi:threonine/homoserine/homoserine lactone efflux protein
MPIHHAAAFALAAFAIIIVPGPSVLFVISRGVALGRRAALATVAGNAAGALLLAWFVAAGLGGIVARSIVAFTVVKVVGALYLAYLGLQLWRRRRELPASLNRDVEPAPVSQIVRQGFVVGVTNPKIVVFFAAVLPQFVDTNATTPPGVQMAAFGLVFATIALVSDGAWGLLAGTARAWYAREPKRLERIGGLGGLVVIGLGLRLALTGRSN